MAKGNMLLGYSKGSVGDVTFYRSGGSQRARARNRNPNNPRTERQQSQRSRFANAVKFYKQVTTNFFRFAYEDKKVNESDYNAFMRHNTLRSGFIGAAASKIANWPALGAWEVTSGSLATINNVFTSSEDYVFDVASAASSALSTIGALSTYLITNDSNFREGDIITALLYVVDDGSEASFALPTIDTDKQFNVGIAVMQFTLDSASTKTLASITSSPAGFSYQFAHSVGEQGGLKVTFTGSDAPDFCQVALIHSRQTANGLLVSTQEMIASSYTDNIVSSAMSESGAYYSAVIADWNAAPEAVLQGAASAN